MIYPHRTKDMLPKGGYMSIPNGVAACPTLPPAAKLVYLAILSKLGPLRKAPIKDAELAVSTGLTRRTVIRARAKLIRAGLITFRTGIGGRRGVRYHLYPPQDTFYDDGSSRLPFHWTELQRAAVWDTSTPLECDNLSHSIRLGQCVRIAPECDRMVNECDNPSRLSLTTKGLLTDKGVETPKQPSGRRGVVGTAHGGQYRKGDRVDA